ncbi:hypothetical protein IJ135_02050 [Candidatus Saccharibacteria bacterium]|nr:hypothetical protein [Candidatus Saccharibacteria bacterium]
MKIRRKAKATAKTNAIFREIKWILATILMGIAFIGLFALSEWAIYI